MGFTAQQVTQFRNAVATFFDETCCVLTRSLSPDGGGGSSVTWVTTQPALACHVRGKKREPVENLQGGTETARKRFEVILPWNATIDVRDRIAVNAPSGTTVGTGANGVAQQFASTNGLQPGQWLYFATAQVLAEIGSVIDGTHVQLRQSVASTTGENVYPATMYEVLSHDSGKSYQTKIICDAIRLNDGQQ